MPPDFVPSQPEKEEVSLFVGDVEVKNFTEYSFNSNFLTPTDGWSFTIGAERLSDEQQNALKPGKLVKLMLNGGVQSTGYIDSMEISASRGSGSIWRIEGRDKLGQAGDTCADPTKSFKKDQTLESALIDLFSPFGWTKPDHFTASNGANVALSSQEFRSKAQASEGKGFSRRRIKQYQLHQYRPYPRESVLEFAQRITQRFGLWIWLSANGEQLVVSNPNFEQDPKYELRRNREGTTNVLEGSVKRDMSEQPTHIVADGYAGGGEFGKSKIIALIANTAVHSKELDVSVFQKYVGAGGKVLEGPKGEDGLAHAFNASSMIEVPHHRTLYLHDDESRSQEHLEAFVRRELALLQRKSLTVSYTVEGHGQQTPDGFRPWTVDTVVHVLDEVAGLDEKLYVLGRTFNKSRSSGTTTHLELIRLNTLVFTSLGK